MKIKWIVFDMMGVLFKDKDDVAACLIPFLREKGVKETAEAITAKYREASLGKISAKEFWKLFGLDDMDAEYLDAKLKYDSEALKTAEMFGGKFNFGIISNDLAEWSLYLRKKYNIDRNMSTIVISGEVGYRKPSENIYTIFLDRAKASAEECIFIDDNLKNLIPAQKLGFKGILFDRDKDFPENTGADYVIADWEPFRGILEDVSRG